MLHPKGFAGKVSAMSVTEAENTVLSRPLVTGPSAWIGAELRERAAEWRYVLAPGELDEIDAAAAAVRARGLDLADITRADFPLPRLGPVLDRLRGDVIDGRGFVLLRGMRVEGRPIAETATAYWGVGSYFGSARSQNGKGITCSAMSTTSARD